MPATKTTDNDQDSAIQARYDAGHGAPAGKGGAEDVAAQAAKDQSEAFERDFGGKNYEKDGIPGDLSGGPKQAEENPNGLYKPGGKPSKGSRIRGMMNFAEKKGGIVGLVAVLFLGGGGLFVGIFGPASLLVNLTENLAITNDSSSPAMERRFMKVFGNMTNENGGDTVCANKKNIKCKMGRISNKALRQLSRKGVVAQFSDSGNPPYTAYDGKRMGYPKKNPSAYTFDTGDGKKITVKAKDMPGFLLNSKNRKIANKVLGTRGAFNMKVRAWTGKHITKKFYDTFKIKLNGGLADGVQRATKNIKERFTKLTDKLKTRIANSKIGSGASAAIEKIKGTLNKNVSKAKKGGVGYLIAMSGCILVKAPSYMAAGVAAIQLAQVLPIVMDVVMSPGHKAKVSGVDYENSITQEDGEDIGMLLTGRTKNEKGKMTAPLDSKYFLAALGINKNKPPISAKYAPGYPLLSSGFVAESAKAVEASEPACNYIMSPTAMYTAMAADALFTVAASATIIGGLIKVAASWAISELIAKMITEIVGGAAEGLIKAAAENPEILNAVSKGGEALGDVLGISAAAFFSAGAMARHLPTLFVNQLSDFFAMQQETENFQREMDIASLSPFDTSSKYTFMGSIVHNMQMAAIQNGGYGITSYLASLPKIPSMLTANAGASTNFSTQYCGYAEQFRLNTGDPSISPAVNFSGLPCTGLTNEQDKMTTDEAISLMVSEGWICNPADENDTSCPDIPDEATLMDLMPKASDNEDGYDGNGFIKPDTLLYEYMDACSDASRGDYIFNIGGCTVSSGNGDEFDKCANINLETEEDKTVNQEKCDIPDSAEVESPADSDSEVKPVKNKKSIAAIAVFLIDYQIVQSINGEDEVEAGSTGSGANPDALFDMDGIYKDSTNVSCAPGTNFLRVDTAYHKGNPYRINLCELPNSQQGGGGAEVSSYISATMFEMFEQMKKDLGYDKIPISSSFRTMAQQQALWARYGRPQAAPPGTSNHQAGLAIDYGGGPCAYKAGIATCPRSKIWVWLKANASRYQLSQVPHEWWHWSPTGN